MLKKIGRIHNANEAIKAAQAAKQAGFENFNLDIMFALPEQTLEQAIADVQQAIELAPSHLSCYQLTLEPNTLFHAKPPKLPSTELAWEMQSAIQENLNNAGYEQYEVSAYAKKNRQCQHNKNYWQFGDYLAIGAGAHGKITLEDGSINRYWKLKQPKQYLQKASDQNRIGGNDTIHKDSILFEFLLNGFRLKQGFKKDIFANRTGLTINNLDQFIQTNQFESLIENSKEHIALNQKGFDFIDSILEKLV